MIYILKCFQKLYKTINQSISCNLTDFFYSKCTERALKRQQKGNVALGYLKDTSAVEHLRNPGTRTTLGHQGNWVLGHLDTQTFGHLGTEARRYSDTWTLETLKILYLAGSTTTQCVEIFFCHLPVISSSLSFFFGHIQNCFVDKT